MADYMTGTLILPTFALTLDPIAAIFYDETEVDEQDDQPDGTTMVIQHEAPYGEFPELETALVAAGIAILSPNGTSTENGAFFGLPPPKPLDATAL